MISKDSVFPGLVGFFNGISISYVLANQEVSSRTTYRDKCFAELSIASKILGKYLEDGGETPRMIDSEFEKKVVVKGLFSCKIFEFFP